MAGRPILRWLAVWLGAALLLSAGACGGAESPRQKAASAVQATFGANVRCTEEGWMVFVGERERVYGCSGAGPADRPRCYVVVEGDAQDVTNKLVESTEQWPCARVEREKIEAAEQEARRKAEEEEIEAAKAEAELDDVRFRAEDAEYDHPILFYKGQIECGKPKYDDVHTMLRARPIAAAVAARLGTTGVQREAVEAGCLAMLLDLVP